MAGPAATDARGLQRVALLQHQRFAGEIVREIGEQPVDQAGATVAQRIGFA